MLIVETIARIRREHLDRGKSIKQIARELKLSRNTVRRVLRSGETALSYERESQPRPKLGNWTQDLDRLLAANTKMQAVVAIQIFRLALILLFNLGMNFLSNVKCINIIIHQNFTVCKILFWGLRNRFLETFVYCMSYNYITRCVALYCRGNRGGRGVQQPSSNSNRYLVRLSNL